MITRTRINRFVWNFVRLSGTHSHICTNIFSPRTFCFPSFFPTILSTHSEKGLPLHPRTLYLLCSRDVMPTALVTGVGPRHRNPARTSAFLAQVTHQDWWTMQTKWPCPEVLREVPLKARPDLTPHGLCGRAFWRSASRSPDCLLYRQVHPSWG